MCIRPRTFGFVLLGAICLAILPLSAAAEDDPQLAAIRKSAEQLVQRFNAGKADEVAKTFLPQGEYIDEQGTIYRGPEEIRNLLTAFFEKFPGVKLAVDDESIRMAGPVAIDEGSRSMTTQDGEERSRFHYIAVWAKNQNTWQLASLRDIADDPDPTPNDYLQPLAWLIGDWINEGTDGNVNITFRWSDDKNFILVDYQINAAEGTSRNSTQRIGWDPSIGRIRSWLFDSDGGFADGFWTVADDGILIKSSSVNPDGTTATATLNLTAQDGDHFKIQGTDRVIGDTVEDDFEITVARRPPAAGK